MFPLFQAVLAESGNIAEVPTTAAVIGVKVKSVSEEDVCCLSAAATAAKAPAASTLSLRKEGTREGTRKEGRKIHQTIAKKSTEKSF